jgi:hypothetical protein
MAHWHRAARHLTACRPIGPAGRPTAGFDTVPGMTAAPSPTPTAHDDAGPAVRRGHRDPEHGHSPWLRPVAGSHHDGPRLEPRDLCLRAGGAEPGVGPGRATGRHAGRPLWRLPRADWWQRAVRRRAGADGVGHLGPGLHGQRRPVAGLGAVRYHLCRGLRRHRAQRRTGKALLGHGHGRGGRLLRSIHDGAGGDLADQQPGLAERTVRAGLPGAGHRAAGLGPARTGGRHSARWPPPEHRLGGA